MSDLPENITELRSLDDLEEALGSEEEEAAAEEAFRPFLLSKSMIAMLAYNSSVSFQLLVSIHEADESFVVELWDQLTLEQQEEYIDITMLAIKMSEAKDEEFARLVHSKRAMQYLVKGYTFDEKHNDQEKKTHMVAPYDVTPYERRVPLLMFKSVVKTLTRIWDQDNPFFAKN